MKIIILTSSYRKRGNTEQLSELIGEELQKAAEIMQESLEVERISLAHADCSCAGAAGHALAKVRICAR